MSCVNAYNTLSDADGLSYMEPDFTTRGSYCACNAMFKSAQQHVHVILVLQTTPRQ